MFENLQEKLELALKRFRGQATISDENISEAIKVSRRVGSKARKREIK